MSASPLSKAGLIAWRAGLLVLAAVWLGACQGVVTWGSDPTGAPPFGGHGGLPPSPDPDAVGPFVPAPLTLRRLTVSQYLNTVGELLGNVRIESDKIPPDAALPHQFTNVTASQASFSAAGIEQLHNVALDLAAGVFASATQRQQLVGCAPSAPGDACVKSFVERFGRRVLKRPLTPEESSEYVRSVATFATHAGGDVWKALEWTVAALLQNPNFLYIVELGRPNPAASGALRLTGYEVAARLAFFLWDRAPDEQLLDAAQLGKLDEAEGVRAQAERMLEDPRARGAWRRFVDEFLNLTPLDSLTKNTDVYPLFTPSLARAMQSEVRRFVEHWVFQEDADLRDLFLTRATFVNRSLATFYGLPVPSTVPSGDDSWFSAQHPATSERVGLLGMAGLLAVNSKVAMTSPTLRGKFVVETLLCRSIPPPPPNVNDALLPDSVTGPMTARDKLERHRTDPACSGCHVQMDPMGLALERFDGIGAFRATDNGLSLDVSGELDGTRYEGLAGLSTLLRDREDVMACVTRQLYRHASGHHETAGEEPAVKQLAGAFAASTFRARRLMVEIAASEAFLSGSPSR